MKPLATIILIISSILSSGCKKSRNSNYSMIPIQESTKDSEIATSLEEHKDYNTYSEDFTNSELLDKTLHFYDESHGNQIEYLSSNGNAYLWYPGNSIILRGKWSVIEGKLIAFSFQQGTFNYVTREKMDKWDYRPLEDFVSTINAKRDGDPFQLSKTLPRILLKNEPIELSVFKL